jgi:predicted deacetylase
MRSLLVSLHDVTPAHAGAIERAFALLAEVGVSRYALFVVPDWHGRSPVKEYSDFVAKVRERAAQGCEIFLHGLRHDEAGSRRSAGENLRAFGRTAREAEFLALDDAAATERVRQGRALLREVGLEAVGFVPPAWLYRPGLKAVLRQEGLGLMEDAWRVYDLLSGRSLRAPCVQWSTRKAHRAAAGVVINALRVPLERGRRLMRLAIHPPDVVHPWVSRSLRLALKGLLATRTPVRYADVLGRRQENVPRRDGLMTGLRGSGLTVSAVPEISRFLGIVVSMYYDDHPPPHFHVCYAERRAIIEIETGALLDGQLPPRALALVVEWAERHREELRENWRRGRRLGPLEPIAPLE